MLFATTLTYLTTRTRLRLRAAVYTASASARVEYFSCIAPETDNTNGDTVVLDTINENKEFEIDRCTNQSRNIPTCFPTVTT